MRSFMALLIPVYYLLHSTSGMKISSPAFADNGNIPSLYSCEGKGINPSLDISGIPIGTKSLAMILHDPDADVKGGFTHWVLWNIQPDIKIIPEDFKGASQGLNGAGMPGYKGMCPPSGTHHYQFKLYALDAPLNLDPHTDKNLLEASMKGHILDSAELTGLYKKSTP